MPGIHGVVTPSSPSKNELAGKKTGLAEQRALAGIQEKKKSL